MYLYNQVTKSKAHSPKFYSVGQTDPINSIVRTKMFIFLGRSRAMTGNQCLTTTNQPPCLQTMVSPPSFHPRKKTFSIKNCCTMITVIIFLILTTITMITMITMITINSVGSTSGQQAGAVRCNEGCKRWKCYKLNDIECHGISENFIKNYVVW